MKSVFDGLEKLGFKNIDDSNLFIKPVDTTTAGGANGKMVSDEIVPEQYLFSRKLTCPVCGKEFTATSVRPSKIRLVKSDTDLKPYYEPFDPLYYDAIVCVHCGYSSLASNFNEILNRQAKLVREKITPHFKTREYPFVYKVEDSIERYKLALLNAVVRTAKNSERAYICLKLSWLAREKNDVEMEKEFSKKALEGFESAYTTEDFPMFGMDELTLSYLIGELHRKHGNLDLALKHIGTVVVSRTAQARLKERAVEVKELILEERKAKQDEEAGKQ